ncbi:hypothetical protein GQ42DRAFT_72479 [Ramicandelaber brevisporus]|nr:hypothetical protein GQ42DRAFT_72479 [Ramicandelaber brevisporus]
MNCCDLFVTARDLCTGLDGDSHASQLNALASIYDWLESSLPRLPAAGSELAIRGNDYQGEEYDDVVAKASVLTLQPLLMELIPELLASNDIDITAATVRVLAVCAMYAAGECYSDYWTTKVLITLCDIVKSGVGHPAFVDALSALTALATEMSQCRVIVDYGVSDFVLGLLRDDDESLAKKMPSNIQVSILLLFATIKDNSTAIPNHSDQHGYIEQYCGSIIMNNKADNKLLIMAACYTLAVMEYDSLMSFGQKAEELERVKHFALNHVPFAFGLLDIIVVRGTTSSHQFVVESGYFEQFVSSTFDSDEVNGISCLTTRMMGLKHIRIVAKDSAAYRRHLAQSGAILRLLKIIQANSEFVAIRIECLLTLAVLSQRSETRLNNEDAETAFTAISDIVVVLTHSISGSAFWYYRCYVLMEAAELLCGCNSRFRSLFTAEAFCSMWLNLVAQGPASTLSCSSHLAYLLKLLDNHLRHVMQRSIQSLHLYAANLDIVHTLVELIDHPCSTVASSAFLCWTHLLSNSYLVTDGHVNLLPISKLVALVTQPIPHPSRAKQIEYAMNAVETIADQLSASQCCEIVTGVARVLLHSSTPLVMRTFTRSAANLLNVLVTNLGTGNAAVLDAFNHFSASLDSSDPALAQRALLILNNYVSSASSTLQHQIVDLVISTLVKQLLTSTSTTADMISICDALSRVIGDDVDARVSLVKAGIVDFVASHSLDTSHTLFTNAILQLLATLCTPMDGFSLPPVARTVLGRFVGKVYDSNIDTLNASAYKCGSILGAILAGEPACSHDSVALVLKIVSSLPSLECDRQLGAYLEMIFWTVSAYLPSVVNDAYVGILHQLVDMALHHRSQTVQYFTRIIIDRILTLLPSYMIVPFLSPILDTVLAATCVYNGERPSVTVLIYVFIVNLVQIEANSGTACESSPRNVAGVVGCLMDDRLWHSGEHRHFLWNIASQIKTEHLAQHGFFDWMVGKLITALSDAARPSAAMSFGTLPTSWTITGNLSALGLSTIIIHRIRDATNPEVQNICNVLKTLIGLDNSLALALLRDGIVEAIYYWIETNDSAPGGGLLNILELLREIMDAYDTHRKPQQPSLQFPDVPPHLLHQPHIPVEPHRIALYNQSLARYGEERITTAARIQPLVTRTLSSLTASHFIANRKVTLWQLEQTGIIDTQTQSEIRETLWSGVAASDNSHWLMSLQALYFHLGAAQMAASSETASWLASSEHLCRLLDFIDTNEPVRLQATALNIISGVISGKTEAVNQLLLRRSVAQLCELALDHSLASCLLEPTIATLLSICRTVHQQFSKRDCVVRILVCIHQLLQRHSSHRMLTLESLSNIISIIELLADEGKFIKRMSDIGILRQLTIIAFTSTNVYSSKVARAVTLIMSNIMPVNTVAYLLAALDDIQLLASLCTDSNGYHLATSIEHVALLKSICYDLGSADAMWQMFVENNVLSSICRSTTYPSFSAILHQLAFHFFVVEFTYSTVRIDNGIELIQTLLEREMTSGEPLLMSAVLKALTLVPFANGTLVHSVNYQCLLYLLSASNNVVNTGGMFMKYGGMETYQKALRSPTMTSGIKLSLLFLLADQNIYDYDPSDLALGALVDEPVTIPDEMPPEYDY